MSSDDPTIKMCPEFPRALRATTLTLPQPLNRALQLWQTLLLRYVDDLFDVDSATATIGVDFRVKKLSVAGRPHRLLLFDTAGQERFRTLTSSYYRNAQGVILVYDVSNRESFLSMDHWFGEAEMYAAPGVVKCLVGSKIDKTSARAVTPEEGTSLAAAHGASFIEVSSKTRENVKKPFVTLVDRIAADPALMSGKLVGPRDNTIALGAQEGGEGYACAC